LYIREDRGLGYQRAYSFGYDNLNRLIDAKYSGTNNGSIVSGTSDRYNEHFAFDKMGNITNFVRFGLQANNTTMIYGKVDDLAFEHNGNQLTKATDSGSNGIFTGDEEFLQNTLNTGNSCGYDANGNRLFDSNSNVWGIKYNILNLPDAIQFYQGHQTIYTYSADGVKLKVVDKTAPAGAELPVTSLNTVLTNPSIAMTTKTDYVGNMIYENGVLKRILNPVGAFQDGVFYYFLKDHLGSNRVVINASGSIVESSSFYPSGMRFGESAIKGGNVQPYRHTGLEMQAMHGLNWIDNLARFRTVSDGGGFTGMDPLAEKYYNISPYAYCGGNIVNRIDPTGLEWYWNEGDAKNPVWIEGDKDVDGYDSHNDTYQRDNGTSSDYFYDNNVTEHVLNEVTVTPASSNLGFSYYNQGNNNFGNNKNKFDVLNGISIFGTASSQLLELTTSKYHDASIDMKEASSYADAFDFWDKIFKGSSSENKIQNQKDEIKEEVIDRGIVTDVDGDAVEWKCNSGINRFNATGVRVNDTIFKQRVLKTIRNGKVIKRDTLLYDTYQIGK